MPMDAASAGCEIGHTSHGIPYVRNQAAISEILGKIQLGHYCTVLGPPHCQKSLLLRDLRREIRSVRAGLVVLLDLGGIARASDEDFHPAFAGLLVDELRQQAGIEFPGVAARVVDETSLQRWLEDGVAQLDDDLVLLLDHLERARTRPLKSLLRVLRAIRMQRKDDARHRLGVVTANSLSAATLALGRFSPFNIAHVVSVPDLQQTESEALITTTGREAGCAFTPEAVQRCSAETGGDRDLLAKLARHCLELAAPCRGLIGAGEVEQTIRWFLEEEAAQHSPLQEMTRTLEAKPLLLMNVLWILDQGEVLRRDLHLDRISEGFDDLQLTGAVRAGQAGDQVVYRIRNNIYRAYLERHFQPERVVRALSTAGQWQDALPFLEDLVGRDPSYRATLLATIIDAVTATGNIFDVRAWLARSLGLAFSIDCLAVYLVNASYTRLELISYAGADSPTSSEYALGNRSLPEVQAFFDEDDSLVKGEGNGRKALLPVRANGKRTVGLVVLCLDSDHAYSEALQPLRGFLPSLARAIAGVIDREHRLAQFSVLSEAGKTISSSLDLNLVLQATLAAAQRAVPAAQKASIFLWDPDAKRLIMRERIGYPEEVVNTLQLAPGEGAAGWVFQHEQPLLLGNVLEDEQSRYRVIHHPALENQKSGAYVPLKAWGRIKGVLCLDNLTAFHAFHEADVTLLSALAAQAASAIQNASLHSELHDLGLKINTGDLTPRSIFKLTVGSLIRLTGAMAANMVLLRDTDNPEQSVNHKPTLNIAEGFKEDYETRLLIRANGLTRQVLQEKRAQWISRPNDPPRINPLAYAQGARAYLGLPMTVQKKIIGVLFVHYDHEHEFSEDEIAMLSLFANQAALAIENARQRDELRMNESVAWMGITFSSLAHQITQKAAATRNAVFGLRRLVGSDPAILETLTEIERYVAALQEIPRKALIPYQEEPRLIDLHDALRESVPQWCRPGDEIDLDLGGLAAVPAQVSLAPGHLAIFLEILSTNAVRAIKDGAPPRKLTWESRITSVWVEVDITNTGKPIPPDISARLFTQPITKSRDAQGAGVGLLIARNIVQHFGGGINLVETNPSGTKFRFWLPLASLPPSPASSPLHDQPLL